MKNLLTILISALKNALLYRPSPPDRFVLDESAPRKPAPSALSESAGELAALLRYARELETRMREAQAALSREPDPAGIRALKEEVKILEARKAELAPVLLAYDSGGDLLERSVSASLGENALIVRELFRLPDNEDIILREFALPANPPRQAMLVFTRGLVDPKDITATVMAPLFQVKELGGDVFTQLLTSHLPNDQALRVTDFRAVVKGVSGGYTALFVDGAAGAALLFTKGFEHRTVNRPQIEQTVRGNQSAFTDTLQMNVALVRLLLRSRDLVTETFVLGTRSQTECAVMYLQSVANPRLVAEVKRRVGGISTDYITAGTLEQFIEDQPRIPVPQTLSTERPDRVSSHLAEGRVAILVDGDPFALIVPISLFTLIHSPEDFALKPPAGTLMRLLRLAAVGIGVLFPALYIALVYYHPEAMPTELLLTVAGAREKIPFPSIVEVVIMEISFEFTREASIRKPGLLGETIGVVGGIILGQAVVFAGLISPVTVVIVAITALASFGIPDYRLGMVIRLARFAFLLAAAVLGLLGVAGLVFTGLVLVCSLKSFGVPLLAPVAPRTAAGGDTIVLGPPFAQERRPDKLNVADRRRQPPVSREWTEGGDADDRL
ncbi:spore germination protein [Anaeroselena agilis]|uniref:Spore germination protein n=1 Tax=Anaeroselena agilis TaxID=3063788 RepID=A0ABU3NZ27_9FIRM|nr:spore germination protein [Selenomonadales bacterium 4137-cl]